MKRLMLLTLAALVMLALGTTPALAKGKTKGKDGKYEKTWSVTVYNLTSGQPMSPPLVVVHKKKVNVWKPGRVASHAAAAIFEDANNAIAEAALAEVRGVQSVFSAEGGPIPPGASRTFTFTSYGKYKRVSLLTMLVNTNDAGTGLHGVPLNPVLSKRLFWKSAYDGGSEVNNELRSHIPGPCCGNPFVRDPEGAVIKPHPGILGIATKKGGLDPGVEGWDVDEPVVKIKLVHVDK